MTQSPGPGPTATAGLWPRIAAFLFDYLPIAGYLIVLVGLGSLARLATPGIAAAAFGSPLAGELTGFVTITLPVTLYFALLEASAWQATWGKRRLKLRVTRTDGQRLSRGRSLLRTGLKFVPWELAHFCIWQVRFAGASAPPWISAGFILVWVLVGANVVSLLLSRQHRTLYDRLSGTLVVLSP
jgi:uncharacterized RDD family membrane protein YckC